MKQIILLVLLLNSGEMVGQKMLPMPNDPYPGKIYAQCFVYDSAYSRNSAGMIPPLGWEEFLIEKTPKHQRFTVELPIFDTLLLKIPVDKATRMADLPDQYGLTNERILLQNYYLRWKTAKKAHSECLYTEPSNCLSLVWVEEPSRYLTVQKRVVVSTAHQERFDNIDTIVFKQMIELKAITKMTIEVSPQFKKVFRKTNPYAHYSEWREVAGCYCDYCPDSTTFKMQGVLKKRGYYNGELDNIMGDKTKAAVLRFQKDNNLPTGNLNYEALIALREALLRLDEDED
jgi:Putative peptidoglycan binding domain